MLQKIEQPCRYLIVQIQQQKHLDKWSMFKVNNRHQNGIIDCRSIVFTDIFEHISHLVLMFLLLTLNRQMPAGENTYGTKV